MRYLRWTTELALDVLSQTFQEALRSRFKDGQREHLAMEMQRNVAAQLFGKIFENLFVFVFVFVFIVVVGIRFSCKQLHTFHQQRP